MRKGVLIPRQEIDIVFDAANVDKARALHWIFTRFDKQQIQLEIETVSDRFVRYDLLMTKSIAPATAEDYEQMKEEFAKGLSIETRFMTLPEQAKLTIKESITLEKFFRAIRRGDLILDTTKTGLHYFHELFKEVATEKTFAKQLAGTLNSPALLDSSKLKNIKLADEQAGHEIDLELIITKLYGWNFIRVASVTIDGSKFQHFIKKMTGQNIYQAGSENVGLLRDDYTIFFTQTGMDGIFEEIMRKFLHNTPRPTLINEDMALEIAVWWPDSYRDQSIVKAQVKELKPDYTIFLE
jgi:hypothetical protein